jgi:NAD(P)H-dependent flavin oxidoreductase YrpB (nitropropane dioxygenase family)
MFGRCEAVTYMAGIVAAAARERLTAARKSSDIEEGSVAMGQNAGLIRDIPPAGEVVTGIAEEAEEILRTRLGLIAGNWDGSRWEVSRLTTRGRGPSSLD